MSKKHKTTETPTIYIGLPTDLKLNKTVICEDVHGQFFLHNNRQSINVVKDAQHKVWESATQFLDENKQTILTYHENLFKENPPKDQDLVTTAMWIWRKFHTIATDRRQEPTVLNPDGTKARKSSLGTRKYYLGANHSSTPELKTPQATKCLQILEDCINSCTEEIKFVTEANLKIKIIERAAELKTRQDPWRIFQYYRPQLISAKLIRHD